MQAMHDDRLDASKGIPMAEVIARLGIGGLKRAGQEMVGPCPVCGGTDRFAVNLLSQLSICRRCGLAAGDQVGLVMGVMGLPFKDALAWLMGGAVAEVDPAEIARRRAKARQAEDRLEKDRIKWRDLAIKRGTGIWNAAGSADAPGLLQYLGARGLPGTLLADLAPVLRYHPALPYIRRIGNQTVTLHTGPAMVARIETATECLGAHCTWIDPNVAGRKAIISDRIDDNKGDPWPAKLIHGSTKGGVITLTFRRSPVMIMGEGIETTLTAMAADVVPGADYWAGISLGNMAGRMRRDPAKPRTPTGWPDMTDAEAFVPPAWVERLIFIQDGDSAADATRGKLLCGLRRAMYARPGLRAQIVHAGEGVDLNDVLVGKVVQA